MSAATPPPLHSSATPAIDGGHSPITELQAGEEATGQKVSAAEPCARYVVHLTRRSQVTVELRESNTAARCVMYLSNQDSDPTANNAMWSAEDPDPRKTVTMLPVDDRFTPGPCYVVVRYLPASGVVFFSLRVTMKTTYEASWTFPKSLAIYSGTWELHKRHGKGACLYYSSVDEFERRVTARGGGANTARAARGAAGSCDYDDDGDEQATPKDGGPSSPINATSGTGAADLSPAAVDALTRTVLMKGARIRQQQQQHCSGAQFSPASTTTGCGLNDDTAASGVAGSSPTVYRSADGTVITADDPRCHRIPEGATEMYCGEWRDGRKDGEGTYTWPTKMYDGHWRAGMRSGKGKLTRVDGTTFNGEWREDCKHGFGVQYYANGTRYEGEWAGNKRHGDGTFYYGGDSTAVRIVGRWENDVLVSDVTAEYAASGETYTGGWQDDSRHGTGVLKDAKGLLHDGLFDHDRRHGAAVWHLPRSVKFYGEWNNDVRVAEGGKFVFPSTDTYRGDWDETRHVRHGDGSCEYDNGDWYEGEWRDDERSGNGILQYGSGDRFEGGFAGNRRHGKGACVFADGSSYEGDWQADNRHGEGRCVYADGSVYVGRFEADVRCGGGKHTAADGSWLYDGQWSGDTRNGRGMMRVNLALVQAQLGGTHTQQQQPQQQTNTATRQETMNTLAADAADQLGRVESGAVTEAPGVGSDAGGAPSGGPSAEEGQVETYEGDWRDGRRHGDGTVTYANGDRFTGQWRDNVRVDGQGTCVYANGDEYEGAWKHEQRHGRGICSFLDGSRFDGEWSSDVPSGTGSIHMPSGDTFYGTWANGDRLDGPGKCLFANGDVYEGEWVDERPHGQGTLEYTDGTTFDGQFEEGEYRL